MSNAGKADTLWFYLSTRHRQASDNLLEEITALSEAGADHNDIAPYCVALITTTGCYLECRINEFWIMAQSNGMTRPRLTEAQKSEFQEIASRSDWRKTKTLAKYQIALATLGLRVFDKGGQPYQDAQVLVSLRNELVHHAPYATELTDHQRISKRPKLEAKLRTLIGECPHQGIKSFFPENCLYQACAEWASKTSQKFVDEFLTRAGAPTSVYVSSTVSHFPPIPK